jgi:hypothetical protein
LAGEQQKRVHFQKMASHCSSDDRHCVRAYMRSLLLVSRNIRKQGKRCKHSVKHVLKKKTGEIKCPAWVHSSSFRKAVTCERINYHFKKWVAFQRCKRKRYFVEATKCASDNIPCLRRTYHSIRRIQHKLSKAHDEFGELISSCDECAPIKIRFRKWLLRQRKRRHRAHLRACACGPLDVGCLQDNVSEIKQIQKLIRKRRKMVLNLHSDCVDEWKLKNSQAAGLLPGVGTMSPKDMEEIMGAGWQKSRPADTPLEKLNAKSDDKVEDLEHGLSKDDEHSLPLTGAKPSLTELNAEEKGRTSNHHHSPSNGVPAAGQVILFGKKKE